MTAREPVETTNLDGYGFPPLLWSRPLDHLSVGSLGRDGVFVLGTVRPDGRPHAAGIGAVWFDGDFYFTSGPGTQKSRNLAVTPHCTLAVRLASIDMVFEGTAARVTDLSVLGDVVKLFNKGGWPAEVDPDAAAFTAPFNAPSAGPGPWPVYRFTFHTAIGVATAEPYGATRWRFGG
jgi:hypothetical protein